MTPVACAHRLVYRYGTTVALDGVDMSVAEGESVALMGPNGSGRTTLLQLLATLRAPDAGTIEIAGVDARRFPFAARAHLLYVGDDLPAAAGLRVREYLEFVINVRRSRAGSPPGDVAAAVQRAHLSSDARVEWLSAGVRQQLALTAALLVAPRLLLLDNPLSSLDQAARSRYLEWIAEVRARGTAVVAAVNTTADAEALCNRVARLDAGHLVSRAVSPSIAVSAMPVGGV